MEMSTTEQLDGIISGENDAFSVESMVILGGIRCCNQDPERASNCIIYTDCRALTQIIQEGNNDNCQSWRAFTKVCEILEKLEQGRAGVVIRHGRREVLTVQHQWANWARRQGGELKSRLINKLCGIVDSKIY